MSVLEELKGKAFPVLDQGWVKLADAMGTDATICERARGTVGSRKKRSDDRTLIRLMFRHHHGSSFEFPEVDIEVKTTFVVWRQMIRHRAGNILDEMSMWDEPSINELSGRYAELTEDVQETPAFLWREQSKENRQGSGDYFDSRIGQDFSGWESEATGAAMDAYRRLIAAGVAKEQARKVFPMGGYTTGFMKMDLRNWLHWSLLRLSLDAQQEIREYAEVVAFQILKPLFPITFEAFENYALRAMTLSGQEVAALAGLLNISAMTEHGPAMNPVGAAKLREWFPGERNRERDEFEEKLKRLAFPLTKSNPEPLGGA